VITKAICALLASLFLILLVSSTAFAQFDDGARYAFIASASSKSIFVIDLQEKSLAHTIELTRAPSSVAASDRLHALVIGHEADRNLTLIDLSTAELTQIEYPLGLMPSTVTMSPVGETVAIFDRETGQLEVHAIHRRAVLLAVDKVRTDSGFTFSADGATIFWVDDSNGTFNAVDLWSESRRIELAKPGSGLSAISRSVDGAVAFVSEASANIVHMIDLKTFAPVLKIHVGNGPSRPWGTADGRFMLVPNNGGRTLTAISTASGESMYTVPAVNHPVFINPGWLDTTAAAVSESGHVAFFDIGDGSVTARYDLNGAPLDGIVTSDSRTLAIPVPENGSVEFFDMRDRNRSSPILDLPLDIGPAAVAISNNLCH
jgi:DNA-binding beta-propeller fold protein YncE